MFIIIHRDSRRLMHLSFFGTGTVQMVNCGCNCNLQQISPYRRQLGTWFSLWSCDASWTRAPGPGTRRRWPGQYWPRFQHMWGGDQRYVRESTDHCLSVRYLRLVATKSEFLSTFQVRKCTPAQSILQVRKRVYPQEFSEASFRLWAWALKSVLLKAVSSPTA